MPLTSSQWARITTLFNQAVERPAQKRKAWLARTCDDDLVRSEVEALLTASDDVDFLTTSVKIKSARQIAPFSLDLAGVTLGPWRIVEAIGRGGMSEVWRAKRSDGLYEQQVAIKMLKRGMDTDALVERFQRERRILARMSHPNIARLIDAGAEPGGRPYLVMEYIAGHTVTEWCESRNLGLRARIDLFEQICEAVHAAHHLQVVHRDLKPSNIMVTAGGEIKLLDFGIAKLIDSGPEPTQTLLGAAPATPEYAAPEQLLGKRATPATDVYSLGVLLYRLLTGATPRHCGTLALTLFAAVRDEGDAERPSAVLRRNKVSSWATVRGDLDSITLKALQHRPERRYQNAGELTDDVRRYLDRRPVLARQNSRFYQLSRFVLRHRIAVAAGSVAALALVAGLCVSVWQARRAEREGLLAQQEAQHAERVKNFLVSVFDGSNPRESQQPEVPARVLIDRSIRQIEHQLAGDPLTRADLYEALAKIERSLGDDRKSLQFSQSSLDLRRAFLKPDDPRIANTMVVQGIALRDNGASNEAEAVLGRAVAIYKKAPGDHRLELGSALADLGTTKSLNGSRAAAALNQAGLELVRAAAGPRSPKTLFMQNEYGVVLSNEGRYAEAEHEVREALTGLESLYGRDHFGVALAHERLADLLGRMGRIEQALQEATTAVEIQKHVFGENHQAVAGALFESSMCLIALGRNSEAIADLEATLKIYPRGSLWAARSQHYIGRVLYLMGRYREAADQDRSAVATYRLVAPPGHTGLYRTIADLAGADLWQGEAIEPERALREAIADMARRVGENAYDTFDARNNLVQTLIALGRAPAAIEPARNTIAVMKKMLGPDHPLVAEVEYWEAKALLTQDDPDNAPAMKDLISHALPLIAKRPNIARLTGGLQYMAALVDRRIGNMSQADAELDQAVRLLREELQKTSALAGQRSVAASLVRYELAQALTAAESAEAGPQFDRAIGGLTQSSPQHWILGNVLLDRARWHLQRGKRNSARKDAHAAVAAIRRSQAPDSIYSSQAQTLLTQLH